MNPLRLRGQNFRSYADVDLELPSGVCAIVGANGAGKSSLLTMIEIALFGAESRSLAPYLTVGAADTEMMVELELEHRGERYRVRRSYSARGRGQAKVDLEWRGGGDLGGMPDAPTYAPESWEPLSRESAAETQALIEQTLGVTRDTFRASAFLAQGDGAAFTDAAPSRRKEILADILGLAVWDHARDRVRADRRPLDEQAQRLAARIELAAADTADTAGAAAERDTAQALLTDTRQRLAAAEAELDTTELALGEARRLAGEIHAARRQVTDRAENLASLDARLGRLTDEDATLRELLLDRDRLATVAGQAAGLEEQHARLTAEHAAYRDHLAARAEAEGMIATARTSREEAIAAARGHLDRATGLSDEIADRLGAEDATCHVCGQVVHGDAKDRAVADLQARHDACLAEAAGHDAAAARCTEIIDEGWALLHLPAPAEPAAIAPVEQELRAARAATVSLAGLDAHARRVDAIRLEADETRAEQARAQAAKDGAQEIFDALVAQVADGAQTDDLEQRAHTLRSHVAGLRTGADGHSRHVARCDERLDRLHRVEAQLGDDREQQARITEELDVLRQLDRAFSRDGIPALIVENAAIPQIEAEAGRILSDLGTPYRVELRTQRALKTGDGVREALDIVVTDRGRERMYETFSGGERTRLNLALRLGLARLLAHRRGADVRCLFLDEPEFLDEQGMDALARVLHGLTGDFDVILVVSHVPALKDAFDQVLEVELDPDGRSRIAAAPIEVPA